MKRLVFIVLTLLVAAPARAQVAVRPFALFTVERFAASTTFDAVFQTNTSSLWGGGVDVVVHRRIFVDLAVSRLSLTGQRAFLNNGEVFRLGIPLRLTSTPVEVTAGYRFRPWKARVVPYAGLGFGSYSLHQSSDFDAAGDEVDVRHAGFLATAGAEFHLTKWVGVTGDVQYTHVPGILGNGGISKDAGDSDLGGIAGRVRVILGR